MAQPIPDGYPTLIPNLSIHNAREAIEFYKNAFGATTGGVMEGPGGKIVHAELTIGRAKIMLSDPFPQANHKPPKEIGGTSIGLYLYVEDVDAFVKRAVEAGASMSMAPEDMFWGDRFGSVIDPFGHVWQIATHVEDVSKEEMEKRGRAAMAEMAG